MHKESVVSSQRTILQYAKDTRVESKELSLNKLNSNEVTTYYFISKPTFFAYKHRTICTTPVYILI
jgi:hypothetical protein